MQTVEGSNDAASLVDPSSAGKTVSSRTGTDDEAVQREPTSSEREARAARSKIPRGVGGGRRGGGGRRRPGRGVRLLVPPRGNPTQTR